MSRMKKGRQWGNRFSSRLGKDFSFLCDFVLPKILELFNLTLVTPVHLKFFGK